MQLRDEIGSIGLLLTLAGCGSTEPVAGPGSGPLSLARGGSGGDALVVDLVTGDFAGDNLVLSSCSGDSNLGYNASFGDTDRGTNGGCLTITTSDGTRLVDDIGFTLGVKSVASTRVQFWGQDAAGPGGIGYESDPMPIDPFALVSPSGFIVHVHARDVPVFRLSGHLSMKRVAQVGTVDVGDMVYRP